MNLPMLPTVPAQTVVEYKISIPYTQLQVPSLTLTSFLVGMPINYVVCGAAIRCTTQFAGSGINSLTCSIGGTDGALTDTAFYVAPCQLTAVNAYVTSGPPGNNLLASPTGPVMALYLNKAHDLNAYFIATGAQLQSLTAGVAEISIQIRPL